MTIRCPCLQEEFIGSDAAIVCRRAIARQKGIQCPRYRNQYKIQESCFHIERLLKMTVDDARKLLIPDTNAIAGTGEPTSKKSDVVTCWEEKSCTK